MCTLGYVRVRNMLVMNKNLAFPGVRTYQVHLAGLHPEARMSTLDALSSHEMFALGCVMLRLELDTFRMLSYLHNKSTHIDCS